jgi:hypothetical protein
MTPIRAAETIGHHTFGSIHTVRILCPFCGRTHVHPWPARRSTALSRTPKLPTPAPLDNW